MPLDPFQSAYKAASGPETALLKVQNDIHRTVDRSGVAVLLDLSAAFGTIYHEYLMSLLGNDNMMHAWFESV